MKIFITAVIAAVVTGAVILSVPAFRDGAKSPDEKPAVVRLQKVQRGDLTEFITAPGQVEPKTRVSISARVAARITALPCAEGGRVTKGDDAGASPTLLVKLDATDLEAALRSAKARRAAQEASIEVERERISAQKANLRSLGIQLSKARRDLGRQKQLFATGDVSQSTVDDLQDAADDLAARIESAQHNLAAANKTLVVMTHNLEVADAEIEKAEDNLSYATIYSPIDGIVTKINTEVGELAVTGTMNNPGTVIMEVADLSRMLLVAEVNESDIGAVEVGQTAKVRIRAYPKKTFRGVVDSVALVADAEQEGKHFRVEILLDTEGQRIYSGLSADVDIETKLYDKVLKVPSQAVLGRKLDDLPAKVRQDNPVIDDTKSILPVLFVARDGRAVATPVAIGASDATQTLVTAGVEEGDEIVVGPYAVLEKLKHDRKIVDEREQAKKKDKSPPRNPGQPRDDGSSEPPVGSGD